MHNLSPIKDIRKKVYITDSSKHLNPVLGNLGNGYHICLKPVNVLMPLIASLEIRFSAEGNEKS